MHTVLIIVGSARPGRIGSQVSEWVSQTVSAPADTKLELTELADWYLPVSDELRPPASGEYVQEHTRAWSRRIASAAGYILVTPQYNWGYPASLKNALDHLYREWHGKPVMIVSYGHRGGGKAAAQLRQVCEGLRMRPTATMPAISFSKEMLDEKGRLRDPATDFAPYAETVRQAARELAAALGDGQSSGAS